MDRKFKKQFETTLKDLGLEIVSVRTSNHLVFKLRNRHGVVSAFTMAKTASDHRAMKNAVSTLRRLAAQQ